ncbi:Holliday junction branch migration protein RuvA [Candidatus Palauibacter sp.]|uniref:Holliday junction branch migration protein RuvA n=1 Tax=Candidatus Palauibacter sp. TaxID=3101350 RepID=UPI003B02E10D
MIRRLRGELVTRGASTVEVVTGDGVGYEVSVPLGLAERLPAEGGAVELHTVLVVRDDAFDLYGFGSARDRELFQRLRTPSGVGPRLALAILGALPPDRVVRAIRAKDHRTLQTVSGVGRKTAERIAIELADKLDDLGDPGGDPPPPGGPAAAAVQALRALGYQRIQSENAVRRAVEALEGREVGAEELVRRALQHV